MKVLDLFSGIGGFSLGMERAGFETAAFCEIDKYAQQILKKHWPAVKLYEDVREITATRLIRDGIRPDVITGGFPCQDISLAGKQKGIAGERSGLWLEVARLIDEVRPRYAIMENVTNLLAGQRGAWFGRVLGDLAEIGYDAEWHCIPASTVGAHHQRDRVWIIAYPNEHADGKQHINEAKRNNDKGKNTALVDSNSNANSESIHRINGKTPSEQSEIGPAYSSTRIISGTSDNGLSGNGHAQEKMANSMRERLQGGAKAGNFESLWPKLDELIARRGEFGIGDDWIVEPNVDRVANGIPKRMDRLKCLGNAVVPQIPEIIGRAILSL